MYYKSNVYIIKEDNWYVANSIETGIASQGKTIEESIENLKETLELYFENNDNFNNFNSNVFLTSLEVDI